jgi:pilus assembly protein CpaB
MKRRVLTIVLAVTLALLGSLAVLVYVNRADARAVAGQQAVTVLVAGKAIPSGTTGRDAKSSLQQETLPASSVSSDAVAEITPDQEALVTSADLAKGQVLLKSMLTSAAQAAGALTIPDGKMAVTITLCAAEAVAGNVRVGSDVAVFDTLVVGDTAGNATAQPNCAGQHKQQLGTGVSGTRVVVPKVRVIAIGPASSATANEDAKTTSSSLSQGTGSAQDNMVLVTVAVDQVDAGRLILLTQTGLPYLALLGPNAQAKPYDRMIPLFPPAK